MTNRGSMISFVKYPKVLIEKGYMVAICSISSKMFIRNSIFVSYIHMQPGITYEYEIKYQRDIQSRIVIILQLLSAVYLKLGYSTKKLPR